MIPFRFRGLCHRGVRLPSNAEFRELLSTTITPDGGCRFGKTTRYDLTTKLVWCHNLNGCDAGAKLMVGVGRLAVTY